MLSTSLSHVLAPPQITYKHDGSHPQAYCSWARMVGHVTEVLPPPPVGVYAAYAGQVRRRMGRRGVSGRGGHALVGACTHAHVGSCLPTLEGCMLTLAAACVRAACVGLAIPPALLGAGVSHVGQTRANTSTCGLYLPNNPIQLKS